MKKTILVTGASKGIGKAIAVRLAKDGFDIVVHYGNDKSGAEATLKNIHDHGQKSRLLQFDISDRAQCKKVLMADVEENAPYYGVVLNAGVARDVVFPAMTGQEWDQVLHTNLDGFYNVLQPLIMPMISQRNGGRIVAMSSVSGVMGNRGQVNYSASKAGLIGAVKSLAVELAKRKITVNCIAPGLIETQMLDDVPLDEIKKSIPMRRTGSPDEVAAAVSFLCSEDASYITRQVISVNGGLY